MTCNREITTDLRSTKKSASCRCGWWTRSYVVSVLNARIEAHRKATS